MNFEVLIVGGGLSGLSAAALLAKRGVKVAVVDKATHPGGSCGAFRRDDTLFDQGSSMLFGWGEKGFNAHRFLFSCLEEPIDIIQHELLYCIHFDDTKVRFFPNIEQFIEELVPLFPDEEQNLRRFYHDMEKLYTHVMVENPSYTTPDEVDRKAALESMRHHPVSYIRFLSYLNKSARSLLSKYFSDPRIFNFFDKLTSTYCYTTVAESPAILSSVMFVDNHVGGSYYPAGSTLFLTGKLEKVIEDHGGTMINKTEVIAFTTAENRITGVTLSNGSELTADQVIYSGTVWNLYEKLLPKESTTVERRSWASNQVPTYPSVALYLLVDKKAIDEGTIAVEMLIGNIDALDEAEVTAYIPSVDDKSICPEDAHVVMAIGPSFADWSLLDEDSYKQRKEEEINRLLTVLEKRWPEIRNHVRHVELATPKTIERYTLKNGGAVAGPKQMLGNHMFKRLHIQTEFSNLFCCGESTVMGTGTPTVTTSGIAAANAVLKQRSLEPFVYDKTRKAYVRLIDPPFTKDLLFAEDSKELRKIRFAARHCLYCEHPSCSEGTDLDVPGIMRRVTVGNYKGAKRLLESATMDTYKILESSCIREEAVEIERVCSYLKTIN
ncbi:MAG: FAD-dependent oxidoreductase [Sphaerochaetaceae bacterium]|nr:FAD-dependent oxidoreductase [Sphaerochaetaceae bacterium]